MTKEPWLRKRSLSLCGHRTSVALEPEFWQALQGIADAEACTLAALISRIDQQRDPNRPLASALRVRALKDSKGEPLAALGAEPQS